MQKDPNLNILLMSPGRTGSVTIVYYLTNVANLVTRIRNEDQNIKPLMAGEVLHSHTASDIRLANDNTRFILNTRNLIESTYSRIIGRKTNRWRYLQNKGIIKPFSTTVEDYLSAYNFTLQYYKDLKPLLPSDVLRIDYSQFKDDHTNLLHILDIPEKNYVFARKDIQPTKTPGTYRDWILNFDEIDEFAKTLDPIPPI
jgi:hypothetical protein